MLNNITIIMNPDYSFMQTGYSNENNDKEIKYNIISMYMIFTEDALKISDIYTDHVGGKIIKEIDILKSLKIRAINGEKFWNQPNIQNRLIEMKNEITQIMDDSEYESELEDNEDIEYIEEIEDIEVSENNILNQNCNCEICIVFNSINDLWLQ